MNQILIVMRRELLSYSKTSTSLIFICMFSMSAASSAIFLGQMFERNLANLDSFFNIAPWLLAIFVPAIAMDTWVKEYKSGTIELLWTMPIDISSIVVGKFCAQLITVSKAIFMTLPLFLTISYLGEPDMGPIISGYVGIFLLAYTFLSFSCLFSSCSHSQASAFILSLLFNLCLLFVGWSNFGLFLNRFLPVKWSESIQSFGLLNRIHRFSNGLFDLQSVTFFALIISIGLVLNTAVILKRKG